MTIDDEGKALESLYSYLVETWLEESTKFYIFRILYNTFDNILLVMKIGFLSV